MIMGGKSAPNTPHHMPPTFLDFQYIASWSSVTRPNRSMEIFFCENNYSVTELDFYPKSTQNLFIVPCGAFAPRARLFV